MRGYFGIGAERISKPMNVGSLFRSAHAFGADFMFTVNANYSRRSGGQTDTSDAPAHVPFYSFPTINDMVLPEGCELVGIELIEDAVDLPSFRHPRQAAYILGPERGSLSPEMIEKCAYTIKIPTKFCINVGLAGAIVMYDRVKSLGKFARRPVMPGAEPEALPEHAHGGPVLRTQMYKYLDTPPETHYGNEEE
ncbi:MAG: RNA methyltransferase [Rhodospirillaceae bacterium]|nr:RNA methyltransferase [Rhodospirillaceae bacterium]MBT4588425.1 RNA methyltransferase [Rhodospirillaceae bacterium]MBT5938834.1 RNA methyltransferase [Rhodospirillaceae bacterium]MBT7267570.1 RNA methyltransferase [Rhodospirillaceae bacterium]